MVLQMCWSPNICGGYDISSVFIYVIPDVALLNYILCNIAIQSQRQFVERPGKLLCYGFLPEFSILIKIVNMAQCNPTTLW